MVKFLWWIFQIYSCLWTRRVFICLQNCRLFFYSYKVAQDGYNEGNCVFSGSGDDLKYGSIDIKHVYVMGYGIVTSFSDLFTNYYPIDYSRNIYYNYE